MNRRHFMHAFMAAGLTAAIPVANRVFAQPAEGDREYVSEFANTVVSLGRSELTFVTDSTVREHQIQLASGEVEEVIVAGHGALIYIGFARGVTDTTAFAQEWMGNIIQQSASIELLEENHVTDGYWLAGYGITATQQFENGYYLEYQQGAFEGVDLAILMSARTTAFQDSLLEVQNRLTIGDAPPFMFMEESKITEREFPQTQAQETATTTVSSGRTTRQSRGSTVQQTPEPTEVVADTAGVDVINTHRIEFMADFTSWAGGLGVLGDETSTDAARATAIETMSTAATDWPNYATRVRETVLPANQASLQNAYYAWGDAITLLGNSWYGMLNGTNDANALFAALDSVLQADEVLGIELGA